MQLAFQHHFPAKPSAVAALLLKEEFLADVATHAGAVNHSCCISAQATEMQMELPAPANAAKVLGSTVRLTITMGLQPPRADGSVPGRVVVTVPGMPVEAWCDCTLSPSGDNTVGDYRGELTVKIPLVGKKIEGQVEPFVTRAFDGIERRANAWLTR